MIKININNTNRVRLARHLKDLTLSEFSDKMGWSVCKSSKLENDIIDLKIDDAKKIAEVLDIPLAFFFKANREFKIVSKFD